MRFSDSKTLRSFQTLTLLALLLQGLILPPGFAYAKGRGSERHQVTFGNNVQAGGRVFYLDARQEAPPVLPILNRVSDCEDRSSLFSLLPSSLNFDGERSYEVGSLWNLNECGDVVPSLGLIQLSQMNVQAGDVLVVTNQDEYGEVYEEEVDASRASLVWSGMKSEMAFVFGEGAGEFFVEVLGAALIGAGIVAIASLHAILGVVLTVVALLVGVYLIGEYADRWMNGEYEEIGRHLVRDMIYLLAAYGGGRSVPILKRGVMGLLRRMPKAKAFFGAMDQMVRSSTQIRQQIDDALGEAKIKGQIDDVLGEVWAKGRSNGSGGSRLRPIRPGGGGVATLSRPRVLPKTELVRKATAPAWKLNPAEIPNVQSSAQAPGAYTELVPGTTAVNAAAAAMVPGTKYGYAEGVGQHNVDRYSEYHLERQGALNTLGNVPRRSGVALAERSGSSEGGSSSRGWIYSQTDDDLQLNLFFDRRASVWMDLDEDESKFAVVEIYRKKFGYENVRPFEDLIPIFSGMDRIRRSRAYFRLMENQRLLPLWRILRNFGLSEEEAVLQELIRYERSISTPKNQGVESRALEKLKRLQKTIGENGGYVSPVGILEAMGFSDEFPFIEGSKSHLDIFYETLKHLPVEHHAHLFQSLQVLSGSNLDAMVDKDLVGATTLFPELDPTRDQIEGSKAKRRSKIWGNMVRLNEAMGFFPLYALARVSKPENLKSSPLATTPLQRFLSFLSEKEKRVGGIYSAYFEALRGMALSNAPLGTSPALLKKWMSSNFPKGTKFQFLGGDPRTRKILAILPEGRSAFLFSIHTNHRSEMTRSREAIRKILYDIPRFDLPIRLPSLLVTQIMAELGESLEDSEAEVLPLEKFLPKLRVSIHDVQVSRNLDFPLPQDAREKLKVLKRRRDILEPIRENLSPELGWDEREGVWRPVIP